MNRNDIIKKIEEEIKLYDNTSKNLYNSVNKSTKPFKDIDKMLVHQETINLLLKQLKNI